ncbi:ribosome biogenesis protein Slx9p [Monosporozyma servazzii]
MVAKKRNTLRGKASSRLGSKPLDSSIFAPENELEAAEDPKAFLHQYRETKKDKQLNKQSAFISKIKETASSEFAGISKSSIRRRKRKLRDDLKPRMEDLLTSLKQEPGLQEITKSIEEGEHDSVPDGSHMSSVAAVTRIVSKQKPLEPGSIKIKKNEPNIRTKKGAKALSIKESQRFMQVLKNDEFKKNSFGALRDIIKMQKR